MSEKWSNQWIPLAAPGWLSLGIMGTEEVLFLHSQLPWLSGCSHSLWNKIEIWLIIYDHLLHVWKVKCSAVPDKKKSISPQVVLWKYISRWAVVLECLWPRIKPFRIKTTSNKSLKEKQSLRAFLFNFSSSWTLGSCSSGETDHQPRLDAWDKCSRLVHWEDPEGLGGEGGGRGDRDGDCM